ncbi:MAG: ATPase, T2SS/T4P/T4SS family, partial [Phycisphaeraceae bacterium]
MMPTPPRLLTFVCLLCLWGLPGEQAAAQTLTDTLGGAAIQQEMQAQQAGGRSGGDDAADEEATETAADDTEAAAPAADGAGDAAAGSGSGPSGSGVQAEPAVLMSVVKPLLALALFIGWAWVVVRLDKDADYFHLKRYAWNMGQIAAGAAGFALLLLIPYFVIGFILAAGVMGGAIFAYVWHRNQEVPAAARWTFSMDSFTRRLDEYQQSQAQRRATVTLITHDDEELDVPRGDHPDAEAHGVFENVLDFALPRNAETVEIAVDGKEAKFAVRIDGMKYPQPATEPAVALKLIDYIKQAAGLDVSDRRKKQTGRVRVDAHDLGKHRLDVETAGSTRGLVLTMAIDARARANMPLEKLGLLDSQRKAIEGVIEERGLTVLVAAPPRHGTTTTLFTLLQSHDPYTTSITAYTEEPDPEMEGISYQQLPEGLAAKQYNEQLATLLRSDPDVVLVSRLADANTARLLANNVEHSRFYVPLQMSDTFETLKAWIKQVGDYRAAGDALGAIVAQRLVRKLCPTCRTPYKPDPAALKKLNLPVDKVKQLYQASGKVMVKDKPQACPACYGLGYRERMGVFEVMVLDDEARDLIANNQLDRLRAHLRKQRMLWLQEAALAKVAYEGTTDIKEVTRV